MPPKHYSKVKDNVGAIGKGRKKDVQMEAKGVFEPRSVPSKCRFILNLPIDDMESFDKKFIELILYVRYCCSEGKKCNLSKWSSKLMCPEFEECTEKFMILSLAIDKNYEISLLIYKPNMYALAVCVEEAWWKVVDFLEHTNLDFRVAKNLDYDSGYANIPHKFSYHLLRKSIISLYKGRGLEMRHTDDDFKTLRVIICESVRFDPILYLLAPTFVDLHKTVTLVSDQIWMINNWETLSTLWLFHDLGYIWNPRETPGLRIDDADKAENVLGLLMHPPNADFLDDVRKCWERENDLAQEKNKDKEILNLRTREMGLEEMEILDDIRRRHMCQMKENEKKPASKADAKKLASLDTGFLDVMRAKILKLGRFSRDD